MKKLLCIFLLSGFSFMYSSTKQKKVLKIRPGLFVKSKSNDGFKNADCKMQESNLNVSSVIPAYFWDAKMITW